MGKTSCKILDFEALKDFVCNSFDPETFEWVSKCFYETKAVEITSVLFLICPNFLSFSKTPDKLGILLNKRSRFVTQPGDLCFPGGGIKLPEDKILSFGLEGFCKAFKCYPRKFRRLFSLLTATALRESWEEIRLNPFRVKIVGVLPPDRLIRFKKAIVPIVAFSPKNLSLRENSKEVEKTIWISFEELLDISRYAIYRIYDYPSEGSHCDFLCFIHQEGVDTEILWGATFRIVLNFMKNFFNLILPPQENLPVVPGFLGTLYLSNR